MRRPHCLILVLLPVVLLPPLALAAEKPGLQTNVRVSAPTRLDWVYTLANQSPAAPPAGWLADYDSTRQTYDLYIPKGLRSGQAPGLVLFVSASDKAAGLEAFRPICEDKQLLFASPHKAGNGTNMRERIRIVLDVLDELRKKHDVDPDRTYLAGFSGGGRVACQIAFALPECFGGVIPICAAGDLREETWLRHRVTERLSVAHVTGENDFNRGEVERFRGAMLADVGVRSKVWVVPKMGHAVPAAAQCKEVIAWLDSAAPARQKLAQTWPASRLPADKVPSREEQADALLAEGQGRLKDKATLYSGLMQLKGVMVRWPDLPAAAKARQRLLDQEQTPDQSWEQEDIAEQRKHLIARARGLTNYATGPIDKQYLSQRPQMAQAASELWKLVLDDGQDAAAVAEPSATCPNSKSWRPEKNSCTFCSAKSERDGVLVSKTMIATLRTSLIALFVAAHLTPVAKADEPRRPNVLFIAIDDLNHWVGHLGRNKQTKTPHLDRLASRGVTFTNAHCAAPICNPSRAALLSGRRPSSTGVYDNGDPFTQAVTSDESLVTTFRKAGYQTLGVGKIWHGGLGFAEQWDEMHRERGKDPPPKEDRSIGGIRFAPLDCQDEDTVDYAAASYAIDVLGKQHDKPFFLAVGFHKPHMPWNVPRKYYDLHPLDQIELPPYREDDLDDLPQAGKKIAGAQGDHAAILASGRWKEAVQAYLAAISYLDAQVGRVLDAYDKSPDKDNTLICLWGDHGWHLGEKHHWRKFALWEEATRAPLIWLVPGVTKAGGRCERPVDFMSLYPTLCDLAKIDVPQHVEGKSIRGLLADPWAESAGVALTTYGRNNHAVRTARWRYIRYADGGEELYDESADPYEWTNLADKPEHAAFKQELAKHFAKKNVPAVNQERAGKGKKKAAK